MTDIFDLFESGEYPDTDGMTDLDAALSIATISQAISLKRIADMLGRMQGASIASSVGSTSKRVIGGGTRAPASPTTRPRDETSIAAGRGIPDTPVPMPAPNGNLVFVPYDGSGLPIDKMAQVHVVWRNGFRTHGAAQQFHWKWNPAKAEAHEILYYAPEAPDPAQFAGADPSINVALERTTAGGEE